MNPSSITILSFGHFGKDLTDGISDAVTFEFDCKVHFSEAHLDLSEFYDASRRQYNGDKLLRKIDSTFTAGSGKTIGLFGVDLFIPILTFIYGQAQLGGRTAIASLFRLSNERYGMIPDERILQERLIKEVIHELGHTCGLIHCNVSTCVMRSCTYVEDIDQKESHFCNNCKALLCMK